MATKLDLPILSLHPCRMSDVDTTNVGSLANVWGVFSKCSRSLEDGARLENMSWRLLSRQTLCAESPTLQFATIRPMSPDSLISNSKSDKSSAVPQSAQTVAPRSKQQLPNLPLPESPMSASVSSISQRSKTLPILSFEKIVNSIQEKQEIEPLSSSITDAVPATIPSSSPSSSTSEMTPQSAPPPLSTVSHRSSNSSTSTAPPSVYESERSVGPSVASDTSAEILACHSVVRGFSPSQASSSYRSSVHLTPSDAPTKIPSRTKPDNVKKGGGFLLGGSSGEDESSFDERMNTQPQQSSLTAGLKRPLGAKKQLSFRDVVESRRLGNKSHEDEEVFESDDDDDVSDSAIDDSDEEVDDDADDDEEGWEDDASENAENGDIRPLFQRVDSKPNLVSRRSLLTTLMNQDDRATAFQDMAMRSAPNDLSNIKRSKTSTNMQTQEESATTISNALNGTPSKPIMRTKSDLISLVSSPKTTRRNMLSTEINEDLRKSILHERLQKKATVNAYSKRVQSARNLPTLPIHSEAREEVDYYGHGIGAYHQAGW